MNHLYGSFTDYQVNEYLHKIHALIHWLLIYKDPKTNQEYRYVEFEKYYVGVMSQICGFSKLIGDPPVIVSVLSILEAAHLEAQKQEFDFPVYRKLILDAQSLVDKILEV